MQRVRTGLERALHSTPSRARNVKPPPRRGPSQYHHRDRPNSSPKSAPSSVSLEHVRAKLAHHVRHVWAKPSSPPLKLLATDLGVDPAQLATLANRFAAHALRSTGQVAWDWPALQTQYVSDGPNDALWAHALSHFLAFVLESVPRTPSASTSATVSKLHQLAEIADRRFASESYPEARQQRRKLILHVGPTNSGKTYNALVALARARTGAYAGPLRLLAHEVFTRFNQGQVGTEPKRVCNLVTGEEQRILDPEAGLISCTVEMFPLTRRLDVGVVDEIQMLGDPQRGSAWTQAVVGSLCDELHLCGEASVVDLVTEIGRELGDEVEVRTYERLSPLVVADQSLDGDLTRIRKGDCLVTFSRSNIFMFKRQIEAKTGLRVAVAYGGLPPEVREEQARAFNAGEYDVLVASDAVGMGLNLKIRRIVFESLHKWDGSAEVRLATPQIKQIAGRAGRYGVHTPVSPSAPDLDAPAAAVEPDTVNGEATTLDADDLELLRAAMLEPTVQVTQASVTPPFDAFRRLYDLLPRETPMSRIFGLARAFTRTGRQYRATGTHQLGLVGDKIAHVHPLTFQERYTFGSAPVNLRDARVVEALVAFVTEFARGRPVLMQAWGTKVGLFDLLDRIDRDRPAPAPSPASSTSPPTPAVSGDGGGVGVLNAVFAGTTLQTLESFHRCLTLYLWLSYRLAPIFSDQAAARELRHRVERAIEVVLDTIRFERVKRAKGSKRNKARFSSSS
ncbi:hypothetical protein JCM11491_006358 [Sporobolomyces phaffii]